LNGGLDPAPARTWRPQDIDGVAQIPLMRDPLSVCAGRGHPLGKHADPSWFDALNHLRIMPESHSVARGAIDAFFAGRGLTPPGDDIEPVSLSLNAELLRLTSSLCLLPEPLAPAHAARGEIVAPPPQIDDALSEAQCFFLDGQRAANRTMDLPLQCRLRECGLV
jgi:DNA-binding transcriptional LysR family regulator